MPSSRIRPAIVGLVSRLLTAAAVEAVAELEAAGEHLTERLHDTRVRLRRKTRGGRRGD